ncbi:MAG: hypothetical protein I8H75_06165 [Myxococcaceae bacterium]|nr:hypothetical protein [Myxococcaceae bacterium]MBH2006899.1 hypothetical protein [Myxococcaceae bacterium]
MEKKSCRYPRHSLTALLVIGLAASIGLGNAGIIPECASNIAWPLCLGLIGVLMLCGKRCQCCSPRLGCCNSDDKKDNECQ